jgi:gamma-glutamyltranspeptidase / glutathione hydrolase
VKPAAFLCVAAIAVSPATAAQSISWRGPAPATSAHAMVVTEQRYATQTGVDILRRGGNAVDAAIAAAYTLAVVDPCCGNIGGGGFMLVRTHDGRERFIDFREKAPLRATPHMYLDESGNVIERSSTKGYLAVAVPGTVMGLERARAEFGTMSRRALMARAILLAQNGYVIEPGDAAIFREAAAESSDGSFSFANQRNVRAIFMKNGRLPRAGEVLVQHELAKTLRRIAAGGAAAFYRGPITQTIVREADADGGMLSAEDFERYTVDEAPPIHCTYRGYDVISAPPPSSGGVTLCETLNVIAPYPFTEWGWNSASSTHYVIEAERRAYADRNTYLGDPAFVNNPVAQLISSQYAEKLRAGIQPARATPSRQVRAGLGAVAHEGQETTHISVVDKWGNAAAITYTINDWFGAQVIAGDTGFFLNDEMDDFTQKPGQPNMYGLVQGVRNDIEPGKRPLSSMAPTILTKDGRVFMVAGSAGGPRIITTVLSTIQNVVDYGMNVQAAVNAPRVHMQWLPDQLQYEPGALDDSARAALQQMGYTFKEISSWGSAQAITVDLKTGLRYGGTDRRRADGFAAGY